MSPHTPKRMPSPESQPLDQGEEDSFAQPRSPKKLQSSWDSMDDDV